MSQPNLNMVIEQVGKDKGIDRAVLIETLKQAIVTAAKRAFGQHFELEPQYNEETGAVDLFQIVNVVETVTQPGREIELAQARSHGLDAEPGDELLFQVFYSNDDSEQAREQDEKYGDMLGLRTYKKGFGRIAAQTAKQVIIQRVREAERELIFNEYKDRKGELINGIVRRFERGNLIVDLGRAEAVLPSREKVPTESYRVGDRLVAFVLDIDRAARGPQIILSRTNKGLLIKLFEQEVPEIYEGIVRIESCAREPGARAKIAVSSRDSDVDPVGACVGMKGSRVQAVVGELRGEKIDIVPYEEDPARFVCSAIQPAEVSRVLIDAENHAMELIVPDDKLSLAIGKRGQNVRLASQLTGWRIDIHSESKVREIEQRARLSMAEIEGVPQELADTMFKLGWRSVADVATTAPEELMSIPGLGGIEAAQRIVAAAVVTAAEHRQRAEIERQRVAAEGKKSDLERLLSVEGIDEALAAKLVAQYGRAEQLIKEQDMRRLGFAAGTSTSGARALLYKIRVYLGDLDPRYAPPPEVDLEEPAVTEDQLPPPPPPPGTPRERTMLTAGARVRLD
ncbi:MAG: transcription termination/antitermination protein NusA [Proteobacteria bacterium]|nr:transcription termination/antitermination protein NusA [Pseudomonadota bacterium]